ncbi:MAG: hypothetical protein N2315_06675 [Thermanaerothrix sp.]|nr:hypothetical protein [Thermanaerothrix sp.]
MDRCGQPHGLFAPFGSSQEDAALGRHAASSSVSISPVVDLSILVLALVLLCLIILVLLIGPRSCPVRAHPKAA